MKRYKVKFLFKGRWYELEISAHAPGDVRQIINGQYPSASGIQITETKG
jgi:hypothetical protein